MFCQVVVSNRCGDVNKIQRSLFLADVGPATPENNWLTECQASLSPCGSLLALSRGSRLTILGTQWDSTTNSTAFAVNWCGTLHSDITCLLAVPISSCGQSAQVYSDWVCVMVGFKSGEVGFYTDQGQLLICEKLEDSPTLSLKCYTSKLGNEMDEVYVVYNKAMCRLYSSNLLQLLCYARVQLAREQAGGAKENLDGNSVLSKKLGFHSYNTIHDAAIIGLDQTNTFDYLATASLQEGFYTRSIRSVAPHNTVCIGVGDPFISFHQALEGGSAQPLLTEVARAVSNRIFGWLGGSRNNAPAEKPLPVANDKLLPTMELVDSPRKGLWAVSSPDRHLLAVYDSFGRITIMDVKRNTIFRMFKGYRDGQVGFLEVYDENNKRKSSGRHALFIVLYVGKRGVLEVWPLRGPRVAVFTAAKHGKLLYSSYGSLQQGNHRGRSCTPILSLIDPDGQIKQLSIPFHFALSRENSDRPRDVHLVRRLRQLIKGKQCDYEQLENEVVNTVKEMKTSDIKIHCVEMLAASRNVPPGVLLTCLKYLKDFNSSDENEEPSADDTKLSVIVQNLNALIRLYMFVNDIYVEDEAVADENNEKVVDAESDDNEKTTQPGEASLITDYEMNNFQHLLKHAASAQQKRGGSQKVTFVEDKRSQHSDFITAFNVSSPDDKLKLKDNVSRETLNFVAYELFNGFIETESDWNAFWRKCERWKMIVPSVLCKLLFIYWMNKPVEEINRSKMEKFGEILYQICCVQEFSDIYVGYNDTSPWWQDIRNILIEAPCPFRSMITAQICRSVAQRIEKEQDGSEESTWVSVSRDNAQWGLLIGKLDDISLLSIVLSQSHEPVNTIPKLNIDLPEINLKFIYSSGKGSITELTAKWLCSVGVDPKDILEDENEPLNEDDKKLDNQPRKILDLSLIDDKQQNMTRLLDHLMLLRKQFPFSLNTDSLVVNMCWEYSKYWTKNIENLTYFQAMLYCLTCISNISLRCGIMSLIWSTHLIHSFECSYKLISKVGKLPREKLCRQDVGLSHTQLLQYLEKIYEFFDIFLCSIMSKSVDSDSETPLKFEPIWEESSLALTELAMTNSKVNIDILQVHHQLSTAIYYQCYLGINFWKHLNYLFDMESQKCMFGTLKEEGTSLPVHRSIESRVGAQRQQFLERLIGKAGELAKGEHREMWVEKVEELARTWRANTDHIRRYYVFKLYAQNEDAEGKVALCGVTNVDPLHKVLVPLAGRRFRRFIEDCSHKGDVLALLTPATTSYLHSLDYEENEVYPQDTLNPTRCLLEEITSVHGEQDVPTQLMKTAHMLLDACTTIQQNLNIGC